MDEGLAADGAMAGSGVGDPINADPASGHIWGLTT